MPKTPRFLALTLLLLAFAAKAAFAQAPASPIAVRASRAEVSVAPGGIITTPFTIRNSVKDSVAIEQSIGLPAGWRTVNSMAPSMIAGGAMELWLVSIAAPAGAPAGKYVLRAGVVANGLTVSDSVVVTIEERYSLEVKASIAPTYVLAGDSYETTFLVHNAGNVTTRVKLKATSNRGSTPKLSATEIDLTAGATQPVKVMVEVPTNAVRSQQDLLEIIAIDAVRDSVRGTSSVETTIIAKASAGSEFWTIPGDIAVRASSANSGVSAFIASGTGRLSENSNTTIDFAVQTAPAAQAMFGERGQYRFGLSTKNIGIRAGDQSFGFSTLTSSGSQARGGEVTAMRNGYTAGAYINRNRWVLNGGTEMSAMAGTTNERATGGSVIALQRNSAAGASRVLGGTAYSNIFGANVELEAAKSDSLNLAGAAGLLRVYGDAPTFQYDLGLQRANNTFAGAQRASSDQHVSVSGQKLGSATLSATVAVHKTNPTPQSQGFGQQILTSSMTAGFRGGSSLEFERIGRNDFSVTNTGIRGTQQSVRGRARKVVGAFDFLGTLQSGVVSQKDSASHMFTSVSASVRARVGRDQFVSAFADLTDGKAMGAGNVGTITSGTSAEVKMGALTAIRLTTTVTAQRDRMSDWVGQADVTIERHVRQAIVALRGRVAESGSATAPGQNAFYIEVRTPLKLPTSRLKMGGRALARVVDAETGRGVQGALVRMGEVAALTDKNGVAKFRNLEGGEYHAVVEGGTAAGQLVEGGNVNVEENARPTSFTLNVTRGARVQARLRRMERSVNVTPTPGTPNTGTDSLTDVGGVQGAVLALISARDTVWQSADDRGKVDFGSIAPGRYTVKVVAGDLPEFTAFEKREVQIDVLAGESRDIELRLVPQVRAVEFIGQETVLIATPKPVPATRQSPNAAPRQNNKDQKQQ